MPDKKKKRSISELLRSTQAKKFLKSDLDLDMLGSGKSERLDNALPTQLPASTSDLPKLAGVVTSSKFVEARAPTAESSTRSHPQISEPFEEAKQIEDNSRTAPLREFEDNSRTSIPVQFEDSQRAISRTDIKDNSRTSKGEGTPSNYRTILGHPNLANDPPADIAPQHPDRGQAKRDKDGSDKRPDNSRTILGHPYQVTDSKFETYSKASSWASDVGHASISKEHLDLLTRTKDNRQEMTSNEGRRIDQFKDNSRTSNEQGDDSITRTIIGQNYRTQPQTFDHKSRTSFLGQFEDHSRTSIRGPFQDKPRTSGGTRPSKESREGRSLGPNLGEETGQSSWMLSAIVGHQRKVLLYVFHSSKENRSRESGPISTEALSSACNAPILSIRKIIQRMEQRGILQRVAYKSGRGGWTRYLIPERLYSELLQWELVTKSLEGRTSGVPEEDEPKVAPPSPEKVLSIEEEEAWNNIDIEPVRAIGFTFTHILQLRKKTSLTPTQIQDSIHAFAFDIYKNKKLPSLHRPVAYFMGALLTGPYVFPENYESPRIVALRKYREKKQREMDLILAEQNEIRKLEFDSWRAKLSSEDENRLAPLGTTERTRVAQLQTYFDENVWPSVLSSFLEPDRGILGPFEDNSRTNLGQSEDDSRTI